MKATIFDQFGKLPELKDVPDPKPGPHSVVIDVRANGICRSDWHAWIGHDPTLTLPHVPGHEMAGVISAVGSEVQNLSVGDRVNRSVRMRVRRVSLLSRRSAAHLP